MRAVPLVLLAFAFVPALPAVQAGTADAPDVSDPAGDVSLMGLPAPQPCAAAVDILAFWVEWLADGIHFHYRFADLGALDGVEPEGLLGHCFYSYADFEAVVGGETIVDSVYVDYIGNPLYTPPWRFYMHESGEDLVGVVDTAAGTIDVLWPAASLGTLAPGDGIGLFDVQVTTSTVGLGVDYVTDFAPDDEACGDCWVAAPVGGGGSSAPPAATSASPGSSMSSTATAPPASSSPAPTSRPVPTTAPPQPRTDSQGDAAAAGMTHAATEGDAKDAPWPGAAALLALVVLAAGARRRL